MSAHPPPSNGLLSDRSVRFWTVIGGITAALALAVTISNSRSGDVPPSTTHNTSNPVSATTLPPQETEATTETTAPAEQVRWQGKVRITEETKNLDPIPPSTGDPAWSTIGFNPESRALSISTWSDGAIWSSGRSPTKQDCANMVGTQSLSDDEKDAIPTRIGLALCLETYDERIAFIRVAELGATYAMIRAIVWEGTD